MGFSNKTTNYDIGLWEPNDVMSYQDWNSNATIIDGAIKRVEDSSDAASEKATEAKTTAETANQVATSIQASVNEMKPKVEHLDTDVDSLITSMNLAENEISELKATTESLSSSVTENTSDIVNLKSNVSSIHGNISSIQEDASDALEKAEFSISKVTVLSGNVTNLTNSVSNLSSSVNDLNADTTELSGNIAAVEADVQLMKGTISPKVQNNLQFSYDSTPTPMPKLHCSNLDAKLRRKLVEVEITIQGSGLGLQNKTVIYPSSIGNFVVQNNTSAKMIAITATPNSAIWDILLYIPNDSTIVVERINAIARPLAVPQ